MTSPKKRPRGKISELEAVAAECHRQWSGWIEYFFTRMVPTDQGYNLGRAWRYRWQRQSNTPYAELSEPEKESDRREARKILAVIRASKSKGGA